MNDREYPIAGFAPGGYFHRSCRSCGEEFHGDKRAYQCEPCAIETDEENRLIKRLYDADRNEEDDKIEALQKAAEALFKAQSDTYRRGFFAGARAAMAKTKDL